MDSLAQVEVKKTYYKSLNTKFAKDIRLSYRARGILVYLLSQSPNWKGQLYNIKAQGKESKNAIRSAIKELVEAGYAERKFFPKKDNKFQGSYYVIRDVSTKK